MTNNKNIGTYSEYGAKPKYIFTTMSLYFISYEPIIFTIYSLILVLTITLLFLFVLVLTHGAPITPSHVHCSAVAALDQAGHVLSVSRLSVRPSTDIAPGSGESRDRSGAAL